MTRSPLDVVRRNDEPPCDALHCFVWVVRKHAAVPPMAVAPAEASVSPGWTIIKNTLCYGPDVRPWCGSIRRARECALAPKANRAVIEIPYIFPRNTGWCRFHGAQRVEFHSRQGGS